MAPAQRAAAWGSRKQSPACRTVDVSQFVPCFIRAGSLCCHRVQDAKVSSIGKDNHFPEVEGRGRGHVQDFRKLNLGAGGGKKHPQCIPAGLVWVTWYIITLSPLFSGCPKMPPSYSRLKTAVLV